MCIFLYLQITSLGLEVNNLNQDKAALVGQLTELTTQSQHKSSEIGALKSQFEDEKVVKVHYFFNLINCCFNLAVVSSALVLKLK